MASIANDPGGRKRIIFTAADGSRPCIRLGKVPQAIAQTYRDNIGTLSACVAHPEAVPEAVLRWAVGLHDDHYGKLAKAGLLPPRASTQSKPVPTLGELIAEVQRELIRTKPLTQANYGRITKMILEYFPADRPIASVTPRDADGLIVWMRAVKKLAPATVARRIKACRFIFKKALRWELITRNPFEGIKAGQSVNSARKAFIPLADAEKLIDGTADREFRCVIALARYGALRTPSETVLLRWSDVRWEKGELFVRSPKTEGHAGGESRIVPLFPRLYEVLMDHFENLPDGAGEFVVSERNTAKNFRTRLGKLIERVGILPWPKLFHNLRASRESELCREYPLTTVCQWLGHRPEVAAAHYLTDPDHDATFQKASGIAARRAARQVEESSGIEGNRGSGSPDKKTQNSAENTQIFALSGVGGGEDNRAWRDSKTPGNPDDSVTSRKSGAQSGAPGGEGVGHDSDLQAVNAAWKTLSAEARANITAIVKREGGEA